MKRGTFDMLLSFLLGFAWALLVLGTAFIFKITIYFGFPFAMLSTLLFIFFCLFCILMLEGVNVYKTHTEELKEQTRLLRRIAKSLDKE